MCPNCCDKIIHEQVFIKSQSDAYCTSCYDYLFHMGNIENWLRKHNIQLAYSRDNQTESVYRICGNSLAVAYFKIG